MKFIKTIVTVIMPITDTIKKPDETLEKQQEKFVRNKLFDIGYQVEDVTSKVVEKND